MGSKPRYEVDRESNTLSLWGYLVGDIRHSETYNEKFFDDATLKSDTGRAALKARWESILRLLSNSRGPPPFDAATLTAIADTNSGDERELMRHFIAYLKIILYDDETFHRHIPPEIATEAKHGNGSSFGKPVWNFDYPDSSFFSLIDNHLVGCSGVSLSFTA
ncbi:hypothetical protein GE09DRAFT_1216415 [Coniochaeta sp. 2T2.1]|nr:hypothetical protein GE09DRAFT_1216415 [Coniochaeta sp. 2T2.1]